MKNLLSLLLFFPVFSFSQQLFPDSIKVDTETGNVKYELIADQPGTKEELYTKAKLWIADNFKSSQSVIQAEDKGEGFIVCKGLVKYQYDHYNVDKKGKATFSMPEGKESKFTLKFYLKDNKYKVVCTDILIQNRINALLGRDYVPDEYWNKSNLEAIRAVNMTEESKKSWLLEQLSEKRAINNRMIRLMEDIRSYMAKKAENDF